MSLNLEQQRQLKIAQDMLSSNKWSFQRYHMHLSTWVYNVN